MFVFMGFGSPSIQHEYHWWDLNNIHTVISAMKRNSGEGTAYPPGAPEFTPGF